MSNPEILGITGPFGSGKTTAANHFESRGYQKITLSSFLAEELQRKGIGITRRNLQDLGNQLRREGSPGILATRALDFIHSGGIQKATIDGIRNLGEVETLRGSSAFVLLGVFADRNIRFQRIRNMPGKEALTREEFDELDYRDLGITEDEASGLQVAKCFAVSDYFIENNSEAGFTRRLDEFLAKL